MSTEAEGEQVAAAPAPAIEPGSRVLLVPPSDEEVAAILAAVEVAWPKPVVAAEGVDRPSRWRFSGRWWSAPIPLRRSRPW